LLRPAARRDRRQAPLVIGSVAGADPSPRPDQVGRIVADGVAGGRVAVDEVAE
jgi:hypothetical protein